MWAGVDNQILFILQGLEFAPHYMLEYQRQTGDRWIRYKDHQGEQVNINSITCITRYPSNTGPPVLRMVLNLCSHKLNRTHTQTHTHTYIHTPTHTPTRVHTQTQTHTYTRHLNTRAHTHTHIHTLTHTHTPRQANTLFTADEPISVNTKRHFSWSDLSHPVREDLASQLLWVT